MTNKIKDTYNSNSFVIVKRIYKKYLSSYKSKIIYASFFMSLVASANAIMAFIAKPAIDKVFITHDSKMILIIPFIFLFTSLIKGISEYYQNYLVKFIGQRITSDIQMDMFKHLLYADISTISKESSGRIISSFTNDIVLLRGSLAKLFEGISKHLLSVFFLVGIMTYLEPVLSVFIFISFPLVATMMQQLGIKMEKIVSSAQNEVANFTANLEEILLSAQIVKSYQGEEREIIAANNLVESIFDHYKKSIKIDSLSSPVLEAVSGFSVAAIIWYGGHLIIEGKTTTGSLFAFIAAFLSVYRPCKSLAALNIYYRESVSAASRILRMLDIKSNILNSENAVILKNNCTSVKFEDIFYKIGSKSVLNGISFEVKKGETISIIGRSGSGKSSIVSLLLRFYLPNSGKILVSGTDINDASIKSLREQITYVSQDVMLFDLSVAENISYPDLNYDLDRVITASEAAMAHEFITGMSDGYNSMLGSLGKNLSGGQRQRISLARALYKNSSILIMDEATSALDYSLEIAIKNNLKALRKGKINIIITHRLSTIKDSDKIIVLNNGKIVEDGNHMSLSVKNGLYKKMLYREKNKHEDSGT